MRRRMVRVTLRPPSDWTLVGSMLRGSETKAPSWDGMCSGGEGVGWYSSQPDTCKHNTNTKTHVNAIISYMCTYLNRPNTNSKQWKLHLCHYYRSTRLFQLFLWWWKTSYFHRRWNHLHMWSRWPKQVFKAKPWCFPNPIQVVFELIQLK